MDAEGIQRRLKRIKGLKGPKKVAIRNVVELILPGHGSSFQWAVRQRAKGMEQRAKGMEHGAKGKGQGARSKS